MEEVTAYLPIRLVPRKGGQVFRLFFFLFFFGFSVFWMAGASGMLFAAKAENLPFDGFRYISPLFGIPFAAVGLGGAVSAIAKLLPASPYYHVVLAAEGITQRSGWRTRRFAWSELSPFGVSERVTRSKNGATTTYWVVALRAADADRLALEAERYRRSILKIDAGEYGDGDGAANAAALSEWLSDLRLRALEHPARAGAETAVPPEFRDAAVPLALAAASPASSRLTTSRSSPTVDTTTRRSGVIER